MAQLAVPLMIAGTAMDFIGGMKQAAGIASAGRAEQAEKQFIARQFEQQAGQERASAQRSMIEANRKRDLALSRARAVGAAGGGSPTDILDILTGIESGGEYERQVALYEGEDAARGLEFRAATSRFEGDQAFKAAKKAAQQQRIATFGKLAFSAGSMGMDKFAPKKTVTQDISKNSYNMVPYG